MNPKKILFASLGISLVSSALAGTLAGWDMYPTNVLRVLSETCFPREEVFDDGLVPFQGRSELSIETTDVDVEFSVGADTSLRAELKGKIAAVSGTKHLAIDIADPLVTIRTIEKPDNFWKAPLAVRGMASDAKLHVSLPKEFSGSIHMKTRNGSVSIDKASLSEFDVTTDGGRTSLLGTDVHIVKIMSNSGAVSIDSKSQEVAVETTTGPIEAKLRDEPEAHSQLSFRSKSGAVRIAVRADASLTVSLESVSGHASSAMNLGGKRDTRANRIIGDLGSARGALTVRTWTGDLSLEKLDQ